MIMNWYKNSFFYHIYPLGISGAPFRNQGENRESKRLEQFFGLIPHWLDLGINAVYFGPVFESVSHGYDTIDYYKVDRRLGSNALFGNLTKALEASGINVVLDGVFNHVSRELFAFRDVLDHKEKSKFCDWFYLDFTNKSVYNDPFYYQGWEGHYNLVKLNLKKS